jgi:transposase
MLHVGLDLSRTHLDVHAMNEAGAPVAVTTAAPDAGGLASLAYRLGEFGQPVTAVIESMTGARFVHDELELRGWAVEIADAVKVKGFAPLACKTDKIDTSSPAGTWCRRSGCRPRACAATGSGPAGGCTWSVTAPR